MAAPSRGLHRQALNLAQHPTFDVFRTLPHLLSLQNIGTPDDLATELLAP